MLRHTFCTHLADVGTIRELAGHADIRTTTIYTAVNDTRLEHAIAERARSAKAFGGRSRSTDLRPSPAARVSRPVEK